MSVSSCHAPQPLRQGTVVVAIESSPNNLDPRVGTDAQSERIDGLLFDPLVRRDVHFVPQPWLATAWERPDERTWIFHLRQGVHFHDGRPLEAADVAWTIDSLRDGSIVSAKSGAFAAVDHIETPDPHTLVLHLRRPDAGLLFNLSDGLFGVVPRGARRDFAQQPVGSGPFRFESASADREVLLERVPAYWADQAPPSPGRIEHLRFSVIPDALTTALELRKGSVDVAVNAVTLDMVDVLARAPNLAVETGPGSPVMYLNFNVSAGPLRDVRVRRAIGYAIDRQAIIQALWRGRARLAFTLLPPEHWAAASAGELALPPFDTARARELLASAGLAPDAQGPRLHLEMKTSTDETTRLLAVILQAQMRAVGIDLRIRAAEFGTFYADITRGAFEMYGLRWIGANEDPDIFRYAFATQSFPPAGGNRGRFSNAELDSLLASAATGSDPAPQRAAYLRVQQILAQEVPALPLWLPDNNIVHTRRVAGIVPKASGSFDFLRTATVKP